MKNFSLKTDENKIALICWDCPDKSMNVIDLESLEELEKLIAKIGKDADVKGVVLTSGKKQFGGGADLNLVENMIGLYEKAKEEKGRGEAAKLLMENAGRLSRAFRAIETMDKPWVAALNGLAMGGCLEMALACHGRVCADDDSVSLAVPEVKVGLLPGAGGTQRLIRMIDPQSAMEMMLQGKSVRPEKAKKIGLVNEICPKAELVAKAKEMILNGLEPIAPWDREKFKPPLNIWSPMGMQMVSAGNALLRKQTFGNYPAATNIMKCVYEGLQVPFDLALKIECRYFVNCLTTPQAKGMIRTFFKTMQAVNKGARRPKIDKGADKRELRSIGVLGAGFMGASIAYVSAKAGLEVVLLDRDLARAQKGKEVCVKSLEEEIRRKRVKESEKEAILERVQAADDFAALKECDLVIEAVFEDKNVKKEVYAKAQSAMKAGAVLASNTSTIPITDLAAFAEKPADFVGIHFFSPVEKMLPVEVIRGEKTADETVALAMDYVMAIRKTPILVRDSRGFYINRCVLRYMDEAWTMLVEGVPPAMIDSLARAIGMPVGPLQLNDEVALDLSQKIIRQTVADLGEKAVDARHQELIDWMVGQGRLGKKAKMGFYEYPEKGKKRLWDGLAEKFEQQKADDVPLEDVKDRYLYTIALEAVRVLEEGVCEKPEIDLGAVLGFGFAPWSGGPLSFVDFVGAEKFKRRADELAEKYGAHFAPTPMIAEMAKEGKSFYGK